MPSPGINLTGFIYTCKYPIIEASIVLHAAEDIHSSLSLFFSDKDNLKPHHRTDAQSWPLDIVALPELSKKGAYFPGLSYNSSDLQDIQMYAVERGIEVIIEFDMPGHTTSIGLSYPELITAFYEKPWTTYCAEPREYNPGFCRTRHAAIDICLTAFL
jgi:N-acetyl-beta-hexosaminidase